MPWAHRVTKINGRPAQILIDEGFRARAPIRELPQLAWFGVYARCDPGTAFWDPEESASLDALEDDLIRLCGQFGRGWAVYVLRIATPGVREYFVYFGSGARMDAVLPSLRAAHPGYRVEYEERVDVSWQRYSSCLSDDE
jgi:hypothetical protein